MATEEVYKNHTITEISNDGATQFTIMIEDNLTDEILMSKTITKPKNKEWAAWYAQAGPNSFLSAKVEIDTLP